MRSWDDLLACLRAQRLPELVFAGVALDVFTQLHRGPRSADELAALCGTDRRGMRLLADALTAAGLLEKLAGRYANGDLAARYLNAQASENKLNAVRLAADSRLRWQGLAQTVRRGGPDAEEADAFKHDAECNRTFIGAMQDIGANNARAIAKGMDLSRFSRLLDVGGGPGSYSIAMLERYPGMRATLIDLPLTLDVAREHIDAHGLGHRMDLSAVDLFAEEGFKLHGSFDLMLISNVLHMASSQDNIRLMARLAPYLEAGGMLVVHDAFIDETRTQPVETALFAVDMLLASQGGDCYTYEEVGAWMRQAGLIDIQPVEGIFERPSLLTGRKPQAD